MASANKKKIMIGIFVAVVALIVVRMVTMETDVNLVTTFSVPDGVALDTVGQKVTDRWAAAVDGKFVVGNDEESVQATASTTKMILALAVLEKKPIEKDSNGEKITITNEMYDRYAWYIANNGSNTAVKIGEEISEYDALVSTMLKSSNNMADALAIWAFGSIEEYQKYATEMIRSWGLEKTTLGKKDASGYDESTTSTAKELAIIGYKVMQHPILSEIVAKKEAEVPVAGKISNTNLLLGKSGISGVKTGYIGEASGYCIVSGYKIGEHIFTVALLNADSRNKSFNENFEVVEDLQNKLVSSILISKGDEVGYYESWWTGKVLVKASEDFSEVNYKGLETKSEILVNVLKVRMGEKEYDVALDVPDFARSPSIFERFLHIFGWKK